ncbi:TWK7-like protein [Mya arenaria]|uniref:TWK7-like protein n=2 Tax=Mya arenaria TaxID=6604 RepID=A0ABY7DXU1_MYAAR|nr:TWK7-like protein [Mya arenaria]
MPVLAYEAVSAGACIDSATKTHRICYLSRIDIHQNMKGKKEKMDDEEEKKSSAIDCLIEHASIAAAIAEPEDDIDDKGERKQTVVRSQVTRQRRYKATCKEQTAVCLKRFCVYMASYVGLTCIVVGYSILGGIIFVELESDHEDRIQEVAEDLMNTHTSRLNQRLRMILQQHNFTRIVDLSETIKDELQDFQQQTYQLVNEEGWNGDYEMGNDTLRRNKWTFSGGLLYSVTVITTIGYGFITPRTTAGRAITMLYALIGIPLTVLCITNIGRGMASLFRALYGGTFCVECRQQFLNTVKNKRSNSTAIDTIELEKIDPDQVSIAEYNHTHQETEVPIIICLLLVAWYIVFGAIMFSIWEKEWDYFVGSYFCFITLSTIGFGDVVPGFSNAEWDDQVKQVTCSLYLLIGLSTLAMCFDLMQQRGIALANKFGKFIGLVKPGD